VVAELRAAYPEPLTAAERTAQEAVATGLVPMPPEAGSIAPPVAAPPPPTPVAVAPPPPAAADPDDTTPPATQFASAMMLATEGQTAGKLTVAETQAVVTGLGLTAMRDLLAPDNHALIPAFRAGVQGLIDRAQA
jgi:hypothetical protein